MKGVKNISISIEWVRNPTWIFNPHCKMIITFDDYTNEIIIARVSGCGYDKESAVVGFAINKSMYFKKLFNEKKPDEKQYYGLYCYKDGYYVGQGCGMKPIIDIIELSGLKLITENHGKSYDYYYFG